MNRLVRPILVVLLCSLAGCAWMPNLKFWDTAPDIAAGSVKVHELRRALLCGTPTEAAVVRLFDSVDALKAWDSDNKLQLDRIELPANRSFVLLEQGLRNTGGYSVELRERGQVDEQGTLKLVAEWIEPGKDRMVTQIVTSLCVLADVNPALYSRVEVVDRNGTFRAGADAQRN